MISAALSLVRQELEDHLHTKEHLNLTSLDKKVELGNISQLDTANGGTDTAVSLEEVVVLSLLNIEEEKTLKNGYTYTKHDDGVHHHNRPLNLNLYLLFSANFSTYTDSLAYLDEILAFFQKKYVFTHSNTPALDDRIEKLIVDIHSINFENLNHLWGVLGGKYLPSIMYKMRMLTIDVAPKQSGSVTEALAENENAL